MKSFPRILIAVSIIIVCVFSVSLVSALEADEASVSLSWSSETIYQGGRVNVIITFQSNSADELDIEYVGIQFDWMASDAFYGRDLSANPVTIASGGSHTFEAIGINIASDVSAGEHSCFVGIDGVQNYLGFSWNSPSSTITILDASEKTFTELVVQVQTKINAAINASYESVEAQSLLQQAKDAYTQAHYYANDGNYQEAIASLETAADYVDQAEAAEQLAAEQSAQQQQLLLYIAIIVIVVVVVAVIAVIWRRKRKMKPKEEQPKVKQPKVKQPPLKEDLTISSVAFSGGNTIDVVVDNSGTKDLVIAEVWINNEKQAFTTAPAIEKIPPNESVHVFVTYAYSEGTDYQIKIVSARKNFHLVSTTAV
jgi:heme/copper-type cytochrome/quinol oxidase subunit 2